MVRLFDEIQTFLKGTNGVLRVAESVDKISESLIMVPGAGLEPAQYRYREILSLLCLPISPPGLVNKL